MTNCGVPLLGALAALVTSVGALVVAWSMVLEAKTKQEKERRSHKERDRAIARALRPRQRPTKDGVTPTLLGRVGASSDTIEISDTEWLDDVARKEGWRQYT
jgi:hypothetical protein